MQTSDGIEAPTIAARVSPAQLVIALYLAALLIPLLALPLYHDDNGRFYRGVVALWDKGRFLTEIYYALFDGFGKGERTNPVDIYPFNLMVVGLALFAVLSRFAERAFGAGGWLAGLGAIAVLSSPLLLENFSYHVDVVGMLGAFVLAMWAALYRHERPWREFAVGSAIAIAGCMFYQTAANIVCATLVVLFLARAGRAEDDETLTGWMGIKAATAVVALAWTFLTNRLVNLHDYVASQSQFIGLDAAGMEHLAANIERTNHVIFRSLNGPQTLLLYAAIALAVVGTVRIAVAAMVRGRIVIGIAALLGVPALVLLIYLPAALFTQPIIFERILMTLGFVFCAALAANAGTALARAAGVAIALSALLVAATSSAYVASSLANREHSATIYTTLFNDIRHEVKEGGTVTLSVAGRPARAPAWDINSRTFPVLNGIIQSYYGSYQAEGFVRHLGLPMTYKRYFDEDGYELVLQRPTYAILRNQAGEYLADFR
ncbi:glucosyltransferase domain-containing protein [Pelagibacterium lacus]|uniref:Glycosyltransferase RgtA/B/C/D-like domain-containing protein n=1 Tax=Pelagibacterium lacus TaxID=2282655 RepID=A0A369WDD7_9HYPH|nr:glucosyltransferase domain-containing protein [Pelagibacterium lacus]RDE10131.1 hypothetical protein DVH29_01680 [Pelagibacterium lacus]